MKSLTDIAKECGIQFGESDVSRDIISRRQLERVIAAALAQHQAKALDGVEPVGFVMVPSGPTREMLNAAIDVDSFKLGDISPLGFRCSPQQLFERCYRAMLAAAPKETL